MDQEIFIKQPLDDEKIDQYEQQSQLMQNEESLEHLVNSLIQNQQLDEDDQFKQQIGKRRINDQRQFFRQYQFILSGLHSKKISVSWNQFNRSVPILTKQSNSFQGKQ
ncbi:unnamed protein product [Paramecium octaurelia]|uniref:Uncharacterized protein n=1 Tax=Paramecium octaurelia TaxID=43137 RepID=A0A8S1TQP4_PAROT|nr:unnamed protein product [Paramecium octaurelia]